MDCESSLRTAEQHRQVYDLMINNDDPTFGSATVFTPEAICRAVEKESFAVLKRVVEPLTTVPASTLQYLKFSQSHSEDDYLEIIKLMQGKGALLSSSLYDGAIGRGFVGVVKYLLEQKVRPSKLALFKAVDHGCVETVKLLLDNGCGADQKMVVRAVKSGKLEVVKLLAANPLPVMAINEAAARGFDDIVLYLAPISPFNYDTLELAVKNCSLPVVDELVKRGAPITVYTIETAIKNGLLAATELLYSNAPYSEQNDWDLLMFAIAHGQSEIAKYIHQHYYKCKLSYTNELVRRGTPLIIEYFVDKVEEPESLYKWAVLYKRVQVIELLHKLGVPRPNGLIEMAKLEDNNDEIIDALLDIERV